MNAPVRRLTWDEDNRLKAVCTGERLGCYTYDAGGERTFKIESHYLELDINGQVYWQGYQSKNQTLYTSPYLVFTNQGYTKHYYAGDQRVASVIGGGLANAPQPLFTNPVYGFDISSIDDYKIKRTDNEEMMLRDMVNLQLPDNLIFSDLLQSQIMQQNVANIPENLIYYYHPDHLGSSSFISDASGLASQHLEYFPFGETFVEENVGSFFTRYKFNAKEQDEESALYYYGARYYDPKTSVFLGVDPKADKFPGWSVYGYCMDNPIRLIDPNGMEPGEPGGDNPWVNKPKKPETPAHPPMQIPSEESNNQKSPTTTIQPNTHSTPTNPGTPNSTNTSTTVQNTTFGMAVGSALYGESARGLTTTTSNIASEVQAAKIISGVSKAAKITGYAGNIITGAISIYRVAENPTPANIARATVSGVAISLNLVNFAVPGLGTFLSIGVSSIDSAGGFDGLYNSL